MTDHLGLVTWNDFTTRDYRTEKVFSQDKCSIITLRYDVPVITPRLKVMKSHRSLVICYPRLTKSIVHTRSSLFYKQKLF